jgi:glycosyltransferase involved in cell wall biosynthesis
MDPDPSATPVLMAWRAMNTYGWGILGPNLFCHWAVLNRIIANNSGARDLIERSNCIPLMHQGAVVHPKDRGPEGWGESDVDEIVAALETLYQSPERQRTVGAAAAEFMRSRTWAKHAEELGRLVLAA